MDPSNKHQVSLRGASAKEISREALLEKVSHERELRNYARRATASAVFIQSVWRRYYVTKKVAEQFQEEWETLMNCHSSLTGTWISNVMLRPFLFFVTRLSTQQQKIRTRDIHCMQKCFKVLLDSLHISDSTKNFCSLAMGTLQERKTWNYQAKKLISLCSFVIAQCDKFHEGGQSIVGLTTLALRLVVVLTDLKGWKSVSDNTRRDAAMAVEDLVWFMGSCNSGLYMSIRRYIIKLDTIVSSQINRTIQTDDQFLITASAMTLALRPFYTSNFAVSSTDLVDNCDAAEQYCLCLLTIPWFLQRLPAVLISALKHQSILSPCFKIFLIRRDTILSKMSKMDQLEGHDSHKEIPLVGWALANIICLATRSDNEFVDSLDHASYVRVVTTLAETFLAKLENVGQKNKTQDLQDNLETFAAGVDAVSREDEIFCAPLTITYMELLRPICQHWHLVKLLETAKMDVSPHAAGNLTDKNKKHVGNLELLDIAYLYSYMLRISSAFNPMAGSLPVLNLLSFTPGFLVILWGELQTSIFPEDGHSADDNFLHSSRSSKNENRILDRRQKQTSKDGTSKLVNALHKFTGKSQAGPNNTDIVSGHQRSAQVDEESSDFWNIEPMRCGPQGIAKDLSCLLHLFCTAYSHLLLVLDDIEFYDKQVPFKLGQQQKIAAMLNTLVYNGLNRETGHQNRALMDSAIRCLHLIYERDCRHQFCPPVLWLSPAKSSRPPIAVAARTHELFSVNMRSDEPLAVSSIGSVVTTTPHVYPFEERVEMFREFINMDQVSRKMAGDTAGPGSRSTEIVVRRGHIVEDGFRQLNSLGPRLKSSIHVSFVSECGLPEAGLDYGGLSKEFLTDISKSAFAPEYGLFSQTSTSDRLLVPNGAARYLENGISMFEFLGRVVGKALYEGILLDYAFSHVFVQKLLGRYSFLDELSTLDPELYRNLMYVKHDDGDVKDLCLDFTVTEESFGKRPVFELKPGGKDTSVTNENKMHYVHAMADYKLNRQIFPFSNAFYRGLTDLISPSWLKLFNASEFNQLLSGGKHDFDVDDLRKNTRYSGGYSEGSRAIKLFWEVVEGFEPKERCMLLKFVTSCSRAPLLGFKHLQPSFTIHKVACDSSLWAVIGGQDVERLPSASTCYNTLKLPTYKRSSTLRAKLLYAINSNAGFELS